jgi:CDP-diacylglycerol--glycerol-3-phosphate 3-phosphatidyltransferase
MMLRNEVLENNALQNVPTSTLRGRLARPYHWIVQRIVYSIAATGVHPGFFTTASVVAYLWACVLFASGKFPLAALAMIIGGICDLLDGPVAARQHRLTLFAHFLDSVLDRYADLIVFVGLLVYFARVNRFLDAIVTGAAMAGAVLASYAQARAESLIPSCNVGFWRRPERVVLLIACALFSHVMLALWVLAVGANITVVHRILYTWKHTRENSGAGLSSAFSAALRPPIPDASAPLSPSAGSRA